MLKSFIYLFLFVILLINPLYAKDDKLNSDPIGDVFISGGIINNSVTPANGMIGSYANIWLYGIGVNLFPDRYDIQISYKNSLQSKVLRDDYYDDYTSSDLAYEDDMDDSSYTKIFFNPIKGNFGDIGFGYTHLSFVTEMFDEESQGIYIVDFSNIDQRYLKNQDPAVKYDRMNVAIISDEYYISYKYPNSNYGIEIGYENGQKPIILGDRYMAAKSDYDGFKTTFGYLKSDKDMINGFNLKSLALSYAREKFDFYDYESNNSVDGSINQLGFLWEVVYKQDRYSLLGYINGKTENSYPSSDYQGDTNIKYLHIGFSCNIYFDIPK